MLRRGLRPNSGLPGRAMVYRQLGIKEDSLHRTVQTLTSHGMVAVHRNSNSCISTAPKVVSSPFNLAFIRSGRGVVGSLVRVEFLVRPSVTTVTTVHTSRASVRGVLATYRGTRGLLLTGGGRTRGSVTFRATVTLDDGGVIIPGLIPVVGDSVPLVHRSTGFAVHSRAVRVRHRVTSTVTTRSTIHTRSTVCLRLVCGQGRVGSVGW